VRPKYFGAGVKRKEDLRLLTGRGDFADGLSLPGMGHLAVLRSTQAHAKILNVDVKRVREDKAALAVLTADDLGPCNRPFPLYGPQLTLKAFTPYPLAYRKVRYVGEPVAAVVASSRPIAEDLLDLISVEYEPFATVVETEDALSAEAARVHDEMENNLAIKLVQSHGNSDAAFRQADLVVRERFRLQRGSGQALEGRAVLATYDAGSKTLTIWSNTQAPHLHRKILADVMGCKEEQIRIIVPDVGGGFGPKGIFYSENFLAPYVARLLGRPVKWVEDRREHFLSSVHEREQVHEVELALKKDGTFLALRDRFIVDMGAYVPWGITVPSVTSASLVGPYRIPHFLIEGQVVYTNKVPVGQLRGAGRPQAVFVTERMVDIAARGLGIDRSAIRLRNLITSEELPYTPGVTYRDGSRMTYDSGDYPESLKRALDTSGYERFLQEQNDARTQGRYLGAGIACFVQASGRGPLEGATIKIEKSGRVTVFASSPAQGQGHQTAHGQVCADGLGVDLDNVDVILGDTGRFPKGTGTFASRTAVVGGSAVSLAAQALKNKILEAAGGILGAKPGDLDIEDGKVFVQRGSERSLSLEDLADLEATECFDPDVQTYTSGTHVAIVEVFPETGAVKILRYVVVDDCGRIINPMIVDGQIQGGVAHGISDCLYENLQYDGGGQLLTTSYLTYLLPTACDVPAVQVSHMEIPSRLNPIGVRGAGELGTIGAPAAIANAIEDALSPLGAEVREFPLPPDRIWQLISEATSTGRGGNAGANG
jgi:aerobic carbon-monoxide dehydrogenase large subunit